MVGVHHPRGDPHGKRVGGWPDAPQDDTGIRGEPSHHQAVAKHAGVLDAEAGQQLVVFVGKWHQKEEECGRDELFDAGWEDREAIFPFEILTKMIFRDPYRVRTGPRPGTKAS